MKTWTTQAFVCVSRLTHKIAVKKKGICKTIVEQNKTHFCTERTSSYEANLNSYTLALLI
jgi:hypothetical protein